MSQPDLHEIAEAVAVVHAPRAVAAARIAGEKPVEKEAATASSLYADADGRLQQVVGTTPNYLNVRDWTEMAEGDVVSERDVRNANKVCMVGIMNIMLVSVTERTREIGLRMAVGARSHHILRQFLVEAVVLCLVGGAAGVLVGRVASILVRNFQHWPTKPSLLIITISVAVSAAVGIVFGFYPAWKASRLDPIEALRYE